MATASEHGDGIVQIAYLYGKQVAHSWHDSMRRLRDYDNAGLRQLASQPLNIATHPIKLVQSRNLAAQMFLDKTDHEWLFFVDTDMGFEPDTVERLVQVADPVERPIVGALCFALHESTYDGMGGFRYQVAPTMYAMGHTADGKWRFAFYGPYPDDTVVPVAATGAACVLIHRKALQAIRERHGDRWFDQVTDGTGDVLGEDLAFCLKAVAADQSVWVHTGIKTSHHKDVWIAEEDYARQPLVQVPDGDAPPELGEYIHIAASLATVENNEHVKPDMLKLDADLERYRQIIAATRPEVIVETGSWSGGSARWLLATMHDVDPGVRHEVISVDMNQRNDTRDYELQGPTTFLAGNSVAPSIVEAITTMVGGRRCMVILDSDHSAAHVDEEIGAYGRLVSPGCYLVVEDTIFGYAPQSIRAQHGMGDMVGSPLQAVAANLPDNPLWSRDVAIERLSPVSHHPAGWWMRTYAQAPA